ncbi:penicillin acylase family protein [Nonomuraea sp. NPDC048826]|uniref:penicillin acylase family protein n=1 Tax=Nonomuraea sp. NPDC048826 TaxID=3364347 RepID=UPI003716F54B
MITRLLCTVVLVAAGLVAPASAATATGAAGYSATIRYTEFGIPHVTAGSYGDAGFGQGYAMAKDNICTLANGYVTVRGERSLFFGQAGKAFGADSAPLHVPATNVYSTAQNNLDSDVYFRGLFAGGILAELLAQPYPQGPRDEVKDIMRGYVAGYNKVVAEGGITDARCAGQPWVRAITEEDAWKYIYGRLMYAGLGQAAMGIAQADGQRGTGSAAEPSEEVASGAAWKMLRERQLGSNAVAAGGDLSQNGRGLLLGNPHFPWHDGLRFWQSHLTIPGELNVSGGSLLGLPGIQIGYTAGVAWSHTVSAAYPFVIYDLKTVPGSPTSYIVDGQVEQMTSRDIAVPVQGGGTVTRRLWYSRYGPVTTQVGPLPLPWGGLLAFSVSDANVRNLRAVNAWFDFNHAQSTAELDQALRGNQGIPWVNTIAADSAGNAYFADIQVVPNVSDAKLADCVTLLGQVTGLYNLTVLDGTRTSCLPGDDPDAIVPGIFGPANQPSKSVRTYVENSNDSPWLVNHYPGDRFTTLPKAMVKTGVAQDLRSRYALTTIPGLGQLTRAKMEGLLFSNRVHAAELTRDDLVAMCRSMPLGFAPSNQGPIAVGDSCDVLAAWDLRNDPDSRGALLFQRFWERATIGATLPEQAIKNPWLTPFSAADPIGTPTGLKVTPGHRIDFGNALRDLQNAGIAYGAKFGDHHYVTRNGVKIPIHGGGGSTGGVYNLNIAQWDPAAGYSEMLHGSSYVQAVSFDGDSCPDVRGFLTYSQSGNPASPHYADQTAEFAAKRWITQRFCEADVLASPALRTVTVTG